MDTFKEVYEIAKKSIVRDGSPDTGELLHLIMFKASVTPTMYIELYERLQKAEELIEELNMDALVEGEHHD